jgi:hypothetical protein
LVSKVLVPSQSPDKLGDFDSGFPFFKGVRGELKKRKTFKIMGALLQIVELYPVLKRVYFV